MPSSQGFIFTNPRSRPIGQYSVSLPNSTWQFYYTGTTTLAPIYGQDNPLANPLANPITADGSGLFPVIYLDPTIIYRTQLYDQYGALQQDNDPGALYITPSSVSVSNGAFTATCPDMAGNPTTTVYWSQTGNLVQLYTLGTPLAGTSNSTNLTLTGLPAKLYPANQQTLIGLFYGATNDFSTCAATVTVTTSGVLFFYQINSLTSVPILWTNIGTKEFPPFCFSYSIV